ncbi:MAG: class II glutamine amidotransferase [Deltaproteobacteria bacterium]|nr:class II glutamine amidotransferase [Deltaproteobacteria bacterium]
MCRIFGFRSVIQSQVHRSLVAADNALCVQSGQNPDGWGVAYYLEGAAHLLRSPEKALDDQLFDRVSGVVASETVLAHVRKATVGDLSVLNCHPFQYGRWTMAHNGEVKDFDRHRDALRAEIAPRLRRYILGDTDSEVIFFLFLTELSAYGALSERYGAKEVAAALSNTIRCVRAITDGDTQESRALLTLIVTDGKTMVATQGGKELHYSTYKTHCADRDSCPHLAPHCEAPTATGFVNHLLFSSEPTSGEAVWHAMKPGDVVGVDWRMRLFQTRVEEAEHPKSEAPGRVGE